MECPMIQDQEALAPDVVPTQTNYTLKDVQVDGVESKHTTGVRYWYTLNVNGENEVASRKVKMEALMLRWTQRHYWVDFKATNVSSVELKLWKREYRPLPHIQQIGSLQTTMDALRAASTGTAGNLTFMTIASEKQLPVRSLTVSEFRMGEMVLRANQANQAMHDSGRIGTVIDSTHDGAEKADDVTQTCGPLDDLLSTLGPFVQLVDGLAEIHPYAKAAWGLLSGAYRIYEAQKTRDGKINDLVEKMTHAYETVLAAEQLSGFNYGRPILSEQLENALGSRTSVLERLSKQTKECGIFISEYADTRSFARRTIKNALLNPDSVIDKFSSKIDELLGDFTSGTICNIEIMVVKMLHNGQHIEERLIRVEEKQLLDDFEYRGQSPPAVRDCMDKTRTRLLDGIKTWFECTDKDTPRMCFLVGPAGTGKSTIARTIAMYLKRMKRLGSSFGFDYSDTSLMPHHLLSKVVRDLADDNPAFRTALLAKVQKKDDRTTHVISDQLDLWIRQPTKDVVFIGSTGIVVDALDEAGNAAARDGLLKAFEALLDEKGGLPSNLRIFVTTRGEPDIEKFLSRIGKIKCRRIDTPTLADGEALSDIAHFIRHEVTGLELDERMASELAKKSDGLFLWAQLACSYINGSPSTVSNSPQARYAALLAKSAQTGFRPLHDIFERVLSQALSGTLPEDIRRFSRLLGIVLTTFEPLPMKALKALAHQIDEEVSKQMDVDLRTLGALLSGVTDDNTPVRLLHGSLRNFLLGTTAQHICIGPVHTHHWHLSRSCLFTLTAGLRFNICNLETSYQLNRDIPDLQKKISENIPPQLSYACRYWAHHLKEGGGKGLLVSVRERVSEANYLVCLQWLSILSAVYSMLKRNFDVVLWVLVFIACHFWRLHMIPRPAPEADVIARQIVNLFKDKFLFWLEALSLLGSVGSAAESLYVALPCIADKDTGDCARDGLKFVRTFARPISESAPHIYLSALFNAPETSFLWHHYGALYRGTASILTGRSTAWPASLAILHGHSGTVNSVAFSPDGTHVVSGSKDKNVRLWDAATGEAVEKPLEGHGDYVTSVAFSPDGTRVVSGSGDKTVRLWDATTGEAVEKPLEGHGDNVTSVAFSPGGTRVVSGSYDNTVRLWDPATGNPVGKPLEGHGDYVMSVAFSPDGTRVVSGSADKTVQLWDTVTGEAVGKPLEGHGDYVTSVAFSPDGIRVVSGSDDKTVRLWDAVTGEAVGKPLEGHGGYIRCVAFSPDGTRVVSGSQDKTVRLWDPATGEAVGNPLEGHGDYVTSVAFSPDGTRVVSGSDDKTIRLWDAATGEAVAKSLEGHGDWVRSVAFSPDGTRVASGSHDKTVRLWDAATGEAWGKPLEGHGHYVRCVAFSPDGTRVVSGSSDYTVRLWDVATGEAVGKPLEGHGDWVRSVAFSLDGTRIVSGSHDNTVRLWDPATGETVGKPLKGHGDWVTSVAFSPDGTRVVSGSDDKTVRLWDAATGEALGKPLKGHGGYVTSVAFSPDGTCIVSGSHDKNIRLWDATTGEAVGKPLEGHGDYVMSVAFSPDGTHVVSGSHDKTVRLWGTAMGVAVGKPLEGHGDYVMSVAFSPDGTHVVSGSRDKTVRMWHVLASVLSTSHKDLPSEDLLDLNSIPGRATRPILLSLHLSHALTLPDLPLAGAQMTSSVDQETGWIRLNGKDQLLWLPPDQLHFLCTEGTRWIAPKMIAIDLSMMAHGTGWASCYTPLG